MARLSYYRTLTPDLAGLDTHLAQARAQPGRVGDAAAVMALPLPDGSFRRFRFTASSVMAPALAAQYPAITTY